MIDYVLFDAPIGTPEERAENKLWPGHWVDATGFAALYHNPNTGRNEYHTGADLNLNYPYFNADKHAPIYAAADGRVVFAGLLPVWGKVIVIEHRGEDLPHLWTRYAHMDTLTVLVGMEVKRGSEMGTVGNAEGRLGTADHLHFDVARIDLGIKPADWPGNDLRRLRASYFDPKITIAMYRALVTPPNTASDERHTVLTGLDDNR